MSHRPLPSPLPLADVRLIEQAEGAYLGRFLDGAGASVRRALGISTRQLGGGTVTAMAADPSHYWSKALGLGFDRPLDADLLAEVVDSFRDAGARSALVAVAPQVLPDDWDALCATHGLVEESRWAKLVRPATAVEAGDTDLDVRALTVEDTEAWARVVREAFGMLEPDLTPMLRGVFDDPAAQVFGAWDGDALVGAGAVHVVGEVASVNTGGTLPSHRNRGVQSALLAARAAAAHAAGCRLLTAETAAPGASGGNGSYRNLLRAGFTHHHDRTNRRWTA